MSLLIWLAIAVFLLFAFVILRGAPYLVSHREAIERGLNLLDLKPGETLIDLGSGSGEVLLAAAKRNILAVGYELNPLLVLIARYRLRKYEDVAVYWADYWKTPWVPAQGIYVFLLPKFMKKLDLLIKKNLSAPIKVVSYSAEIPGKKAQAQDYGLSLYIYS